MKIIAIVAADNNNAIGKDNKMPWHLPNDFKFFKLQTLGHPILMGRNTYESIGKPLPQRENIVISKSMESTEGIKIFPTIVDGINYCREKSTTQLSIIGGGTIYKQTHDIWDEILMTRVDTIIDQATVHFPHIDESIWQLVWEDARTKDDKHLFDYTFQRWIRK